MIENLLLNIKNAILADENFRSCLIYPDARGDVAVPAVFLEVANYSTRNANIEISSSRIRLNCGSSSIDVSGGNISLTSGSIITNPPICKCAGGF